MPSERIGSWISWRMVLMAGIVVLLALGATPGGSSAGSVLHGPRHRLTYGTSTNWSGYAALTDLSNPQTGSVTAASGTWTVPTVDCSVTANGYSATWVGIDGYASSTVEQLGTEQDCNSGVPGYSAWIEMYPSASQTINRVVKPGDVMTASVTYSASTSWWNRSGSFHLQLTNATQNWTYSTTQSSSRAQRTSAEWIQEAPSSYQGTLPLVDFNTVGFTNASATINGVTGPIDSPSWQHDAITMEDGNATATPGGLTDSGNTSSFQVTWAGPTPPTQPNPPPTTTVNVHVASITYSATGSTLSNTVTVDNASGQPVSGATVAVTLSNTTRGQSWSASGTTGSDGKVSFSLSHAPTGTYTTKVTSVTGTDLAWDGVTPTNSYRMRVSWSFSFFGPNVGSGDTPPLYAMAS